MNPTASAILPACQGRISRAAIVAAEFSAEQLRRAFEVLKRRAA